MNLFWISRHEPTTEQAQVLQDLGFQIGKIEDLDAYASREEIAQALRGFDAIFTVHPRIAGVAVLEGKTLLTVISQNRAPEGARPEFIFSGFQIIP